MTTIIKEVMDRKLRGKYFYIMVFEMTSDFTTRTVMPFFLLMLMQNIFVFCSKRTKKTLQLTCHLTQFLQLKIA